MALNGLRISNENGNRRFLLGEILIIKTLPAKEWWYIPMTLHFVEGTGSKKFRTLCAPILINFMTELVFPIHPLALTPRKIRGRGESLPSSE